MEIVAVDIGGTHARFALAEVGEGRVRSLGPETVLKTAEHASLQTAWEAYARELGRPLPDAIGIALAAPVNADVIKLTNNPWIIRPGKICERLNVASYALVNDFAAVAHAISTVSDGDLVHICGPNEPLPRQGVISVVGPGTGLGVAMLHRTASGDEVIATEGGHIDYAPLDTIDDAVLATLRKRYRRVSAERVISGPALADLYAVLAALEGQRVQLLDDKALWALALSGADSLATAALDRFCLNLGSIAGDIALAQGASGLVIAGGLGLRLAEHLPRSGFSQRFTAKGRFEHRMADLPVKLITHPQPGLLGAAAAFAAEHR